MAEDVATVAHLFKLACRDEARDLYAADEDTKAVSVQFGLPAEFQVQDLVAFTSLSTDQDPATLGTNRSRDEVLLLDAVFSSAMQGGDDIEELVSDRCYDLLRRFERRVRMAESFAPLHVRDCFLLRTSSDGMTPLDVAAKGWRNIAVIATFQAHARISR